MGELGEALLREELEAFRGLEARLGEGAGGRRSPGAVSSGARAVERLAASAKAERLAEVAALERAVANEEALLAPLEARLAPLRPLVASLRVQAQEVDAVARAAEARVSATLDELQAVTREIKARSRAERSPKALGSQSNIY